MPKIPPLVSAFATGPLGLMYAPRIWIKLLLEKHGLLADGYNFTNRGSNEWIASALGFDYDELADYVRREEPDYLTFEKWLVTHAKHCTPETIAAWNEKVKTMVMPSPRLEEWSARFGTTGFTNAYALNDLDDWTVFHDSLSASKPPSG